MANIDSKLNRFISKQFVSELADIVIYQEDDGSYNLFNTYHIIKVNDSYVVSHLNSDQKHTFYNIKNATSWCIFDKRNKVYKANRIIELDRKLTGAEVEIQVHERMVKKSSSTDDTLIRLAKLGEARSKRKAVLSELQSYIIETTIWQNRRFGIKA